MARRNAKGQFVESGNPAEQFVTAHEPWMDATARELAAQGASNADICRALGISYNTFYRWKNPNGAADREDAKSIASFAEALNEGRSAISSEAEMAVVTLLRTASSETVKLTAATKWLKVYDPDRWGERSKVEMTGRNGGPIETHDLSDQTMAQLQAALSALNGNSESEESD